MTQYELEKAWTTDEGISGVVYRFGDVVRVKNGEHAGQLFRVIALFSLTPEPNYGLTRCTDETYVSLMQSEVEPTRKH